MIFGAPDGFVPFDLARHAGAGPAGHVPYGDDRHGRLCRGFGVFGAVVEVTTAGSLPADRVAPHGEIVSRRIAALARLARQAAA